jgi:Tol biopolymer transport system component
MGLAAGGRVGAYEIVGLLGAGGMGEVYRARDTRLQRDVAIKILPELFALDPDRRARFEREAQVLASLNHPHIAAIYGFEDTNSTGAIVMELVEGPTLADRIARGPVPIGDALAIAKQLVLALDAAHEKGIVHRDLKPANIKLTADGTVKVLDFGLAKALTGDAASVDISQSPTLSAVGTRAGVILGTAAYMSPEQARGQFVDKRADIWAFGCVLYELLTGRKAFHGDTVSDVVVSILTRDPDLSALPSGTPSNIRTLLERSLDKEPKRRLRDIGDAGLELEGRSIETPVSAASRLRRVLMAVAVLVAGILVGLAVRGGWSLPERSRSDPITFTLTAPDAETFTPGPPAPSPDGRRIAFVARDAQGRRVIRMRSLDSAAHVMLAGTDDASGPFWSPDGRSIGFFTQDRLKRVDIGGGPVQNICAATADLGATWNRAGVIVLAPHNRVPLHRVGAAGGTPQAITELDANRRENSHRWPHFLPDGRRFLYTARSDVRGNTGIYVGSLDSKQRRWLVEAQSRAVYAQPGYLLFVRDGTLLAQRFDPDSLDLSGEPVALAGQILQVTASANAAIGIAANGSTLTYQSSVARNARLTWFDRSGKELGPFGPDVEITQIRLSPNDRHVAVVVPDADTGNRDIWMVDANSGTTLRLTSHPATDWHPVWFPDGSAMVFASDRNGRSSIILKSVDAAAREDVLMPADDTGGRFPDDVSSNGRFLVFHEGVVRDNVLTSDLSVAPLANLRSAVPLVATRFRETGARFSPDAGWVAYASDESGRFEVYIRRIDKPETRRVSSGGGVDPVWRRDGRELFYIGADNVVMGVKVDNHDGLSMSIPHPMFRVCRGIEPTGAEVTTGVFDVTSDGQRFLLRCPSSPRQSPTISVTVNWTAALPRNEE